MVFFAGAAGLLLLMQPVRMGANAIKVTARSFTAVPPLLTGYQWSIPCTVASRCGIKLARLEMRRQGVLRQAVVRRDPICWSASSHLAGELPDSRVSGCLPAMQD